jgi:hypothetical protein
MCGTHGWAGCRSSSTQFRSDTLAPESPGIRTCASCGRCPRSVGDLDLVANCLDDIVPVELRDRIAHIPEISASPLDTCFQSGGISSAQRAAIWPVFAGARDEFANRGLVTESQPFLLPRGPIRGNARFRLRFHRRGRGAGPQRRSTTIFVLNGPPPSARLCDGG